MKFTKKILVKTAILISLLLLVSLFFYFDIKYYLNIEYILREKQNFFDSYNSHPVLFVAGFLCFYILYTTLSLPGAALLTLVSGFIFDFVLGSLIVSVGSTIGATCSFLISRFFLKDYIQNKFSSRLKSINDGFKKTGFFYLLSLRLIPAVPFFLVNIFMGVTSISVRQYVLGSFLGMLPGTLVYVNAGKQLASINSASDILSLPVLASFIFLAFLPWIIKALLKINPLSK